MQSSSSSELSPSYKNFLNAQTPASRTEAFNQLEINDIDEIFNIVAQEGSLKHLDFLFQKYLASISSYQAFLNFIYAAPQDNWEEEIKAVLISGDYEKLRYIISKGWFKSINPTTYSIQGLIEENLPIACKDIRILRTYLKEIKKHAWIMNSPELSTYLHKAFLEIVITSNKFIDEFILDANLSKKFISEENFTQYLIQTIKHDKVDEFTRLYEFQKYIYIIHKDCNKKIMELLIQEWASENINNRFLSLIADEHNIELYGNVTNENDLGVLKIRTGDLSFLQQIIETSSEISDEYLYNILCHKNLYQSLNLIFDKLTITTKKNWEVTQRDEDALLKTMLELGSFKFISELRLFFEKIGCEDIFGSVFVKACQNNPIFLDEFFPEIHSQPYQLKSVCFELLISNQNQLKILELLNAYADENWHEYLINNIDLLTLDISEEFLNFLEQQFHQEDVQMKIFEYRLRNALKTGSEEEFEIFFSKQNEMYQNYLSKDYCQLSIILASLESSQDISKMLKMKIPKKYLPTKYSKAYFQAQIEKLETVADQDHALEAAAIFDTLEYLIEAYYKNGQTENFETFKSIIDNPKVTLLLPQLLNYQKSQIIKILKKNKDSKFFQCLLKKQNFFTSGIVHNMNVSSNHSIEMMLNSLKQVMCEEISKQFTIFNISDAKRALATKSAPELMQFNLGDDNAALISFKKFLIDNCSDEIGLRWEYEQYLNNHLESCQALQISQKLEELLFDEDNLLKQAWNKHRQSMFSVRITETFQRQNPPQPIPDNVQEWLLTLIQQCQFPDGRQDMGFYHVLLNLVLQKSLLESDEFNCTPWGWAYLNDALREQIIGQVSSEIEELKAFCLTQINT